MKPELVTISPGAELISETEIGAGGGVKLGYPKSAKTFAEFGPIPQIRLK